MKLLQAIFLSLLAFLPAGAFVPSSQSSCANLAASIKEGSFETSSQVDIAALAKKYELVKAITSGKGGAYVAIIRDSGVNKILKIFPSISQKQNKYNYREFVYTCINSFITYEMLGITGTGLPRAFPALYEAGITNSPQWADVAEGSIVGDMTYPYMIFEFIDGKSLTDLAINKNKDVLGGYQLYDRAGASAVGGKGDANKNRTEIVLYQIIYMQNKLDKLDVLGEQPFRYRHADMNPGNVFVRNQRFTGRVGGYEVRDVPVVTFIDFGHSTSGLDDLLGSEVKSIKTTWQETLKVFSGSLGEFYSNLNNVPQGKFETLLKAVASPDADTRLFMQTAKALFDSSNYIHDSVKQFFTTCNKKQTCAEGAPAALRAGGDQAQQRPPPPTTSPTPPPAKGGKSAPIDVPNKGQTRVPRFPSSGPKPGGPVR